MVIVVDDGGGDDDGDDGSGGNGDDVVDWKILQHLNKYKTKTAGDIYVNFEWCTTLWIKSINILCSLIF